MTSSLRRRSHERTRRRTRRVPALDALEPRALLTAGPRIADLALLTVEGMPADHGRPSVPGSSFAARGRPSSAIDYRGYTTFEYDNRSNLIKETSGYDLDGDGVVDPITSLTWTYDIQNHLTSETREEDRDFDGVFDY